MQRLRGKRPRSLGREHQVVQHEFRSTRSRAAERAAGQGRFGDPTSAEPRKPGRRGRAFCRGQQRAFCFVLGTLPWAAASRQDGEVRPKAGSWNGSPVTARPADEVLGTWTEAAALGTERRRGDGEPVRCPDPFWGAWQGAGGWGRAVLGPCRLRGQLCPPPPEMSRAILLPRQLTGLGPSSPSFQPVHDQGLQLLKFP